MVLRSLGIALCGVELRPLNLGGESFKVRIDDERGRQLLVVVLKGDLVFPFFRHLHPDCSLSNPSTTVGSGSFQQIRPCVAVQASLAEVLAPAVLTLVIEEAIKVLDPGEVMLTGFLDHQQIYAGHSIRPGAEPVISQALIPTKYVNGQVIQLLHFWDLRDFGVGASILLKYRPSSVGYFDGLSIWSQAGTRADRSAGHPCFSQ